MKRLLLIATILLISISCFAQFPQTYYVSPALPPGSNATTVTVRTIGTDSLARLFDFFSGAYRERLMKADFLNNYYPLFKLKSDSTGSDGYLKRGSLFGLTDARYVGLTGTQTVNGVKTFGDDFHLNGQLYVPGIANASYDSTGDFTKIMVTPGSSSFGGSVQAIPASQVVGAYAPTISQLNAKADTATYIKRIAGVIHLASITQMQAYTGTATSLDVDAPGSGGHFEYNSTIIPTNNYTQFAATGKGSGAWVRIADLSKGINILWDPRIKADAVFNYTTRQANVAYTDNTSFIQAMINSVPRGAIKIVIPETWPYLIGITSVVNVRQNTSFEGQDSFFPLQNSSDSLKFSPLSGFYCAGNGFASATDSNYRMQAPVFRRLLIQGSGKSGNYIGVDLKRNNSYTGSNVNYRDPGLALIEDCYFDGFKTAIDLKTANDARIKYTHFSYYQTAIRGGKNAIYVDRADFFQGDTAMILKGNANYVINSVFEGGSTTSTVGLVGDSLSTTHIQNNHAYNIGQAYIFRAGCYDIDFANNVSNGTLAATVNIVSAGANIALTNNTFTAQTVTPVSISGTTKVIFNDNKFTNPQNGTHVAVSASGSTIQWGLGNVNNDYTDANKFTLSTSSFIANDLYARPRNVGTSAGYDMYDPGTSLASPSYKGASVQVGSGYNVGGYNGTGYNPTVRFTGFSVEAQSSSAQGTDAAIYATVAGSTSPALAMQIKGDGRFRLLRTGRAAGDIQVAQSDGYYDRLGIGANGSILTVSAGTLAYSTALPNGTTATTQAASDNTTKVATTAFVKTALTSIITGTPTISAGAGAGTSPTVSVTTNGVGLQVTVTTGTLPTGTNATVATVTLPNALSYTPYPVFSSGNAVTSLLSGASMIYMTSTGTANVTITSGTTALTAATTYVWNIAL